MMAKFKPQKDEKVIISLRISMKQLEELDTKAARADISRNEMINQCIKYALDNMAEEDDA